MTSVPTAAFLYRRGFTLIEAMIASAILAIALAALYGAFAAGRGMRFSAQQRLDAEAIAFDNAVEIFNTANFTNITLAVMLPARPVPASSTLATNSEIRAGIFPNTDTPVPYKWDIEVRVKMGAVYGGPPNTPENDVVMKVTRYAVKRN